MSILTGKEALIALAEGKTIENWNGSIWWDVEGTWQIDVFLKTDRKFRLKPRTITINGIEVPECGKDYKYGNAMYILNSLEIGEYCVVVLDKADEVPAYWWRTEDEIRQVVAALRKVFGGTQ